MLKIVKHYAVHAFGLSLSLMAIYHTMTQLSTDPLIRQFFGIGGIFAGLSIQYLRGLSAAYRRHGNVNKANWLWVPVVVCIILFDFLSSFGILLSQVDKSDVAYSGLTSQRVNIQEDINTLKDDLTAKKAEQRAEFEDKGRGRRYEAYQVEIDKLEGRLEVLKGELLTLNAKTDTAPKSIFTLIGERSGIPAFWIELVMFSGLMFLIYFVPLLTPWDVTLPGVTTVTPVKHVTAVKRVTPVKVVTGSGTCICGAPAKPGSKYCGNPTCRVRASRANKRLAEAGGGA